jgi:hypothetical protein
MKLKTFTEHINESTSAQGLLRLIELGLADLPVRIEYVINMRCTNDAWKLLKTPVEDRDWDWLDEFHDISKTRVAAFWEEHEGSSEEPVIIKEGRVPIARIISDDELKLFGPKFGSPDEFAAEIEERAREYIIRTAQTLPIVPVWVTETDSGILYSVESGTRLN